MNSIELLIVLNSSNNTLTIADNLRNVLKLNNSFKVYKNYITFDDVKYEYKLDVVNVSDFNITIFNITFKLKDYPWSDVKLFLREFKSTILRLEKDCIYTLLNTYSKMWSSEMYSLIYNVENNMRKLIFKFMLLKLGIRWHKEAVPENGDIVNCCG